VAQVLADNYPSPAHNQFMNANQSSGLPYSLVPGTTECDTVKLMARKRRLAAPQVPPSPPFLFFTSLSGNYFDNRPPSKSMIPNIN
jgi:hypothetical protein